MPLEETVKSDTKGGYWYLWTLAVFYLALFPFRYIGNGKRGFTLDILLGVFIYMFFCAVKKMFHIPWTDDIFSIGRCVAMWPFFLIGYFSRKYNLVSLLQRNTSLVAIALIVFIAAYIAIEYIGLTQGKYTKIAGISMSAVLVYAFSKREDTTTAIENQLSFIGRNSLEVYIFHYFFLYNLNVNFIQTWALNTHNGLLELVFIASISIIITYLSICVGWIFHQEKWLQRIVYGG